LPAATTVNPLSKPDANVHLFDYNEEIWPVIEQKSMGSLTWRCNSLVFDEFVARTLGFSHSERGGRVRE
jgi:hypothetical protein